MTRCLKRDSDGTCKDWFCKKVGRSMKLVAAGEFAECADEMCSGVR